MNACDDYNQSDNNGGNLLDFSAMVGELVVAGEFLADDNEEAGD